MLSRDLVRRKKLAGDVEPQEGLSRYGIAGKRSTLSQIPARYRKLVGVVELQEALLIWCTNGSGSS